MTHFVPRSDMRDRELDMKRMRLVTETISTVCGDLEREIEGLTARYTASRDRANEFLMAYDENAASRNFQSRLDAVEAAMIYCEKRLSQLEKLKVQFSDLLNDATRIDR